MQDEEEEYEIRATSKTGIKDLDEYCMRKNISIKYNKNNQICGFRKNDYPSNNKLLDIKQMFTFSNENENVQQ